MHWLNRLSAVVTAKEREKQSFAPERPAPPAVAEGLIRWLSLSPLVRPAMGMAAKTGAGSPAMFVPAKGLLLMFRVRK